MYKKLSVQYRQDVPKSTRNIQAKLLENSRAKILQEFNFKQFHGDMVGGGWQAKNISSDRCGNPKKEHENVEKHQELKEQKEQMWKVEAQSDPRGNTSIRLL